MTRPLMLRADQTAKSSRYLVLGVGCRVGTPVEELEQLARAALADAGLTWERIRLVATIDRRLNEPGVIELARRADAGLLGYSAEALAAVVGMPSPSGQVRDRIGVAGVCEPAAILASEGGELVAAKRRSTHATVAIAGRGAAAPTLDADG